MYTDINQQGRFINCAIVGKFEVNIKLNKIVIKISD